VVSQSTEVMHRSPAALFISRAPNGGRADFDVVWTFHKPGLGIVICGHRVIAAAVEVSDSAAFQAL
jgi:hypothetical protein